MVKGGGSSWFGPGEVRPACAWSTFNLEKCPKCPPLGLHSVPLCHPSPQQSFISENQDLPGKSSFVVLGMFGFLGNPC